MCLHQTKDPLEFLYPNLSDLWEVTDEIIVMYIPIQTMLFLKLQWFRNQSIFAFDSRYAQSCPLISLLDGYVFLRKWSPQCLHLWIGAELASWHCILDECICNSFCNQREINLNNKEIITLLWFNLVYTKLIFAHIYIYMGLCEDHKP